MSWLSNLFGSGVIGSVERIATEIIETDKEEAEAKALFIKTLDPNGVMRRDLSKFTCVAYGFYLVSMVVLALITSFGWGDAEGAKVAIGAMKELFFPITTAWGAIIGASFGVNGLNVTRGK